VGWLAAATAADVLAGLDAVAGVAEALAVGWVEAGAAVFNREDVVAVLGWLAASGAKGMLDQEGLG